MLMKMNFFYEYNHEVIVINDNLKECHKNYIRVEEKRCIYFLILENKNTLKKPYP